MYLRYVTFLVVFCCICISSANADCLAPQYPYVSEINHQSASLYWTYAGSNQPTYQVQWRSAGNASWHIESPVNTTLLSLTGLVNNTAYEWRVRTICATGDTSSFSSSSSFQTNCIKPDYLSTNRIDIQSTELRWGGFYGPGTYEVQWRPVGATSWNVIENLVNSYVTLVSLPLDTYFEWRVRKGCGNGAYSDFVNGTVFNTPCMSPLNLFAGNVGIDAAELIWTSQVSGTRFDLQWRQVGASTWNVVENISGTDYTIKGLTNETTYEWQVRSSCSATSKSEYTNIQTFRTRCPEPANLTASSVTYNDATLEWQSISPVNLQWRQVGASAWSTALGVSPNYSLGGLINNTSYELRIQTVCAGGSVSAYSPIKTIMTRCEPPSSPYAYAGSNGVLQLSWYSNTISLVEVQWRVAGTLDWQSKKGISGREYTITGLTEGIFYEWRVRSTCSSTEYSEFVTGQSMLIPCTAATVVRQDNMTDTSIDLVWNDTAPGTYEVQWRLVNTTNWATVSGITTTRYKLTGLANNSSYEWRLRKVCSSTSLSEYTYPTSFTIRCQQPTYFASQNVSYSSATLTWNSDYYSNGPYELQYRPAGTTGWTSVFNLSISYSLTGLAGNTTYEWRVRSTCSAADFSAIQTFITQCNQPILETSVTNIDVNWAELQWHTSGNARQYEIQYRAVTNTDWITVRPDGSEIGSDYVSPKRYTLYGLQPGQTYVWRIRLRCSDSVYSDFVDGASFTTSCTIPIYLYGSQLGGSTLVISWSGPTLLSTYELQWRQVGASVWNEVSGITAKSYQISGLPSGASYEFRIRQLCSAGVVSEFSAIRTYTLLCHNPTVIATTTSATSIRLTWSYWELSDAESAARIHELRYRVAGSETWTILSGITGKSYSLTGLVAGSTYEYQVVSVCESGMSQNYLATYRHSLSCPATFPGGVNAGNTSAVLTWFGSQENGYRLRWRVAGTLHWNEKAVLDKTYALTGLTNNTRYEWSVATDCGGGFLSDFLPIQTFQTACATINSVFTNSIGANRAQLYWYVNGLLSEATFTVQYRVKGAVVWSERTGLTATSLSMTGLANNSFYDARVKVSCGNEELISSILTFKTACGTPYNWTTSVITSQTAGIVWVPNADNAPIDLQWRNVDNGQDWQEVSNLTGGSYILTGLAPGTNYSFRVRSVCSLSDRTTWGYPISFSTLSTPKLLNVSVNTITAQSATVSWGDESINATYRVQWRKVDGSWATSGPITTKVYMLSNLELNTNYEVRVGYLGSDNGVTYGPVSSFTTYCYPVGSLQVSMITSQSARLSWFTNFDRTPVTVQWRVMGVTAWSSVSSVTAGTYSLTGLQANTLYEWRIQTPCSENTSQTTYLSNFRTVCQMPTGPEVLYVASGAATVRWSGVGPAYAIRYRAVGEAGWTSITNVTSTTYSLTGLQTGTTYEWAVATVCESTGSTIYTSALRFTASCSQPENLDVYTSSPNRAQLTWSGLESSYLLQYRPLGTSVWISVPAITSPYILGGLSMGTEYEWRVRASCSTDSEEAFRKGYTFSVSCWDVYSSEKTASPITSSSASLLWTVKPLMNYQLRWRAQGATAWAYAPTGVTSPYTLTGLSNNSLYEWQIASECQPDFDPSSVFRTSCDSPTALQVQNITSTSSQLKWNKSEENVAYELRWRQTGSSTWHTVSGISSLSYSLTGLNSSTGYEWQVRSQCSGGSDFPITATFKTVDDCQLGTYTIRSGDWNDPTVWSCGRIPIATDRIQIKHTISIPRGLSATIASVRYDTDGKLIFGTGAGIKIAGGL